jgi:hypothetical protein
LIDTATKLNNLFNIEFVAQNLHQAFGIVDLGDNPAGLIDQSGDAAFALGSGAAEEFEAF